MADIRTGAADWRSEGEKRKSLFRKSAIALLKCWIPDHPEASIARGEVHKLFSDATQGYAQKVSLVSLLSAGSEDMFVHSFMPAPLSLQELLVQREGTDAFLDPKTALRVVRRKFGMMTLIARMASTFDQRNIISIRINTQVPQEELIRFCRCLTVRVQGTAIEEEVEFRKRFREGKFRNFEVLYQSELVGRRVPVDWTVKELYSLLGRQLKDNNTMSEAALTDFAHECAKDLGARALRQLSLYANEMRDDLDAAGFDPFVAFIKAADQRLLLTATRSIFDEFQGIRAERRRAKALEESGEFNFTEDSIHLDKDGELETNEDFVSEARLEQDDARTDDFMRLALALQRIRDALGRKFFHRISMVSGDVNFVDAAMRTDADGTLAEVEAIDPVEGLRQARDITEALYRARALNTVTPKLLAFGKVDEAAEAAMETLSAARSCQSEDAVTAYGYAINALIQAEQITSAAAAVDEALSRAHQEKDFVQRSASLMRVISTLMEAGALPPLVRRTLSRAVLGHDVHFWGKEAVKPPLIEAILSLLSGVDDDTLIFLQKVVVHPDLNIRRSVLRTLPLDENEHIRNMLVSHLKDKQPEVRIEVMERIGWSGDPKLVGFLLNVFRHDEARTAQEKRILALNIARIDHERYIAAINAMLGRLASPQADLVSRFKPGKDDRDYQIAALEVLYHLKSRGARRLIYHAATKGRGGMRPTARKVWALIKNEAYADPVIPRSSHDPEFTEADEFNFRSLLSQVKGNSARGGDDGKAGNDGIFSRIRGMLFERDEEETFEPPSAAPLMEEVLAERDAREVDFNDQSGLDADGPSVSDLAESTSVDETDTDSEHPVSEPREEIISGPPRAALRFEASLQREDKTWSGQVPMRFALHEVPEGGEPVWTEDRSAVPVTAGRFEVTLGLGDARLPGLPQSVWLSIVIDGEELSPRCKLSHYRSVVQG